MCQGCIHFSGFLHHFELSKLVTSSIRVKTLVMPDFQDHCTVRPGLPGHCTTRATILGYFIVIIMPVQIEL